MKKVTALFLGGFWFFLFASPVHAYLDPGSGSMLIQLVLGGIAGLLVIGKLYWHKLLVMLRFRSENVENAGESGNIE